MRRLISHLAQFSSLSKQGEVLCTRGLEFLLENVDAREKFASYLSGRTGLTFGSQLEWRAEVRQADRCRPDLEGCTKDGKPVVKLEAKLGAALGENQLRSYVVDLVNRGGEGIVLVVVPRYRSTEAINLTSKLLVPEKVAVLVASWDDILDLLGTVTSESFAGDLIQFTAMYRALVGDEIEPLPDNDAILAWREREDVFINLVDRVTRKLNPQNPLPLSLDRRPRRLTPELKDAAAISDAESSARLAGSKVPRGNYLRRYVCRHLDASQVPCFSVGVRDAFPGFVTPVWMRFHCKTPAFSAIQSQLRSSTLANQLVEYDEHVWLPLDVPLNTEVEGLVDSLVAQVERVWDVVLRARSPTM